MIETPAFDKATRRVKRICESQLCKVVKMPVEVDPSVARIIALKSLTSGGDSKIWLNGQEQNLKSVRLRLVVSQNQ